MAENLKTTKLNDGTIMPNLEDNDAWYNQIVPGYCWVLNDISLKDTYGAY